MIREVEKIASSREFYHKVASMFPNAVSTPLSSTLRMSGDVNADLGNVVAGIAKVAYLQRRERSLINSGLQALQELEDGY